MDKCRHGAVAAIQRRTLSSGSWLVTMSVMTATLSAPAASTSGRTLGRDAADGDEGAIDPGAPFGEAGQALRRPRHRLERRRIDGTERDVVGPRRKRRVELFGCVGAYAEPDPGPPDGREVGRGEILLAEMDEVRACSIASRQ